MWSATPTDSCAAANVSAPTCASIAYAPSIIHRRKIRRAVGTGVGAGDPHRHLGIPGHKKGTLLQRGAGHATPSIPDNATATESAPANTFAYLYHGLKIGVYAPEASMGKDREKPLNTDSTTTMAIVATVTPANDITEITLTARCDFFAKR